MTQSNDFSADFRNKTRANFMGDAGNSKKKKFQRAVTKKNQVKSKTKYSLNLQHPLKRRISRFPLLRRATPNINTINFLRQSSALINILAHGISATMKMFPPFHAPFLIGPFKSATQSADWGGELAF